MGVNRVMSNVNWDSLIKAAVNEGIKQVAEKKSNDLAAKDIPAATKTVSDAVKEQIAPVIENQTNQEPWYKSRVTRGAVVVILSTIAAIAKDYTDDGTVAFNDIYTYGATLFGAAYTIYGRFTASGTPTI